MKKNLIYFLDDKDQALSVAQHLHCTHEPIALHRFPDGESLVRLPGELPSHIVLYRTLDHPNDKLIETILCCASARSKGVKRITLVSPYLCYMRQDRENEPGEAISQKIIGELLSRYIDDIITVDPHLHRIQKLQQAYPVDNAISLSAAERLGAYIRENFDNVTLIGPDEESLQWVSIAAKYASCEYRIASKTRLGDTQVEITLPEEDFENRNIVLVDDMISTGGTITNIAQQLVSRRANILACVVTHCLCSNEDEKRIIDAGVPQIISCDSVTHHSNRIQLGQLLASAIEEID